MLHRCMLGLVGWADHNLARDMTIQVQHEVFLKAVERFGTALTTVPHVRILNGNAPIRGHLLLDARAPRATVRVWFGVLRDNLGDRVHAVLQGRHSLHQTLVLLQPIFPALDFGQYHAQRLLSGLRNWCAPEQIAWSRERIAEGAMRAHRDPGQIQVVEYIRVCVDPDVEVARRAFARSTMGYALGQWIPTARERQLGYRAHFERMGYTAVLAELDHMRQRGATPDEVADAFPPELLKHVGYYGTPEGAAAAFRHLAEGLDVALVRVVAARPGIASVLTTLHACRPTLVNPL